MDRIAEEKILPYLQKYKDDIHVDVIDRETIKVQCRNVSLWLNDSEFLSFIDMLKTAERGLINLRTKQLRKLEKLKIPLSEINEYDDGHDMMPDDEHRKGIDDIKKLIHQGKHITPILIRHNKSARTSYERLDGYKRYMAFKELGFKTIDCYLDDEASYGGQTGVPAVFYDWKILCEHSS